MFAKYPGRFATAAALGIGAYLYLNYAATPRDNPAISLKTPGVGNIEKAYTNAGATPTHTKAYGGTHQGDKSSVYIREGGGTGETTKVSPFEKEGMGDEQRPRPATKGGEIFDQTMLGSHKGGSCRARLLGWKNVLTNVQENKEKQAETIHLKHFRSCHPMIVVAGQIVQSWYCGALCGLVVVLSRR